MKKVISGICVMAGLAAALAAGGCAGLVEIGGRALDGSAFGEKTLESYRAAEDGLRVRRIRRKGGETFIAITLEEMPNLRLTGGESGPEGGFYLDALDFFCSSQNGWNEFSRELSGSGTLRPAGTGAVLRLDGAPLALDISGGKIRRKNARISGDQALQSLRYRQERIGALTEWMHTRGGTPEFADQGAFEEYWRPLLFPELAAAKKRPAAWNDGEARWVRGEEVNWNRAYTEKLLPEELRPVRDSGALLRDWEEAAGWIYFQYNWDRILESLGGEIPLIKDR
jgi:hypothetical protein